MRIQLWLEVFDQRQEEAWTKLWNIARSRARGLGVNGDEAGDVATVVVMRVTRSNRAIRALRAADCSHTVEAWLSRRVLFASSELKRNETRSKRHPKTQLWSDHLPEVANRAATSPVEFSIMRSCTDRFLAFATSKQDQHPRSWIMFVRHVINRENSVELAHLFDVTPAAVRLAGTRLMHCVEEIIRRDHSEAAKSKTCSTSSVEHATPRDRPSPAQASNPSL